MNTLRKTFTALSFLLLAACAPSNTKPVQEPEPPAAIQEENVNIQSNDRTIMLSTSNWKFSPNTIRIKKGENVSLHLMGVEGNHGISIPGLGIEENMPQGGTNLVKVPTDKAGTYRFSCNVPSCGLGHSRMQGTIIIE